MDTENADQLVQRIRQRTADPATRTEERPSEFWSSVTSQSLGGLLGMGRSVALDLGRLLRNGPDDALTARAEEIGSFDQRPSGTVREESIDVSERGSVTVQNAVEIARSPEDVLDYLTNITNEAE